MRFLSIKDIKKVFDGRRKNYDKLRTRADRKYTKLMEELNTRLNATEVLYYKVISESKNMK